MPLSRLIVAVLLVAGCNPTAHDLSVEARNNATVPAVTPVQEHDGPAPLAMYPRSYAPEGARVFIIEPVNGARLASPVQIEFGASNVAIVRAGEQVPGSGHHHLIVDAELPDERFPIPANANYLHFGDASTSTELSLPPGEHRLRLLLGDHLHIPHLPPIYSELVVIMVTE